MFGGIAVGTAIGAVLAKRVPMTEMPELVAFFNGLGGAASMMVALAEIARASWLEHGAIIEVARLEEAIPLIDRIAPEHLELAIEGPRAFAESIRNAGSIFLGRYTPEAIGDYMAGPNHVLPTARSARFSSGLSVLDFMKRSSLISCDAASLQVIGPAAACLAEAEGLDAHAASLRLRLAEHPKP
jgi:histidinol dehydrogenase